MSPGGSGPLRRKNAVGALSLPERPGQARFYSQTSALPITPASRHSGQTPWGAAPALQLRTQTWVLWRGDIQTGCVPATQVLILRQRLKKDSLLGKHVNTGKPFPKRGEGAQSSATRPGQCLISGAPPTPGRHPLHLGILHTHAHAHTHTPAGEPGSISAPLQTPHSGIPHSPTSF